MKRVLLFSLMACLIPSLSFGGLVARWDFNNYDADNPTSAAILAPTVGDLAAIPCTESNGTSVPVSDGTLGAITVLNTGLPEGDWALAIPPGAHLKIPLPAGIVRDKNWALRIRFYSPLSEKGNVRTLISGKTDDLSMFIWSLGSGNHVYGHSGIFGATGEENNSWANAAQNYTTAASDKWHSLTAHFGSNGASSTLNGYRAVSACDVNAPDVRGHFTFDGFLLCAGPSGRLTYISSVEVWDDAPCYHDQLGGAYLPQNARTVFTGCSLAQLRDLYVSAKGLGSWGQYARTISSWEHIVTTDGAGNITNLKLNLGSQGSDQVVLCEFTPDAADTVGRTLRMQYGIAWPNMYFTATGSFVSGANVKAAGEYYNYPGYAAWNLYALPFRPFTENLNWTKLMGSGKFGSPVFSVFGNNPILTFDVSPQADSLTFDCGSGEGRANVTLAFKTDALKKMSALGDLIICRGVKAFSATGVFIAGKLKLEEEAAFEFLVDNGTYEFGDTLLEAAGGIVLPTGKTVADVVNVAGGSVMLSADGTKIQYAPKADLPISAVYVGRGDRSLTTDPLNWQCRNYAGVVLDGVIPDENTTIAVTGATSFNIPAGQSIRCRKLTISDATLEAECDWSGLGPALPLTANASVNLNGHRLTVAGLESSVAATIQNSNATPAQLCVSNTLDTVNTLVAIAGNVKFVKMGAGSFTADRAGQSYTQGTEVKEGLLRTTLNGDGSKPFGPATTADGANGVIVRQATLEIANSWFTPYLFILDGGTFTTPYAGSTGKNAGYDEGAVFGRTKLLSDSVWKATGSGKLRLWNGEVNQIDLGGNTLTVNLDSTAQLILGTNVNANPNYLTNGTMVVEGGLFRVFEGCSGTVEARTVRLRMNSAMSLSDICTVNICDYEPLYDGTSHSGTGGVVNVFGTFKPSAHDKFYGVTMKDGSTIDLSLRETPLPSVSSFTTGCRALKFADDAQTVSVKLGKFKVLPKKPVITWTAETKPRNVGNVRFKLADPGRKGAFFAGEDGLYLMSNFVIFVQ
jgi:hypothetical protein